MAIVQLRNRQIDTRIFHWLDLQGDRFADYAFPGVIPSRFNLWAITNAFTYDDYISFFLYLSENCPDIMRRGPEEDCPDIISALQNPIFRSFFGLPDP